jgi:hypothetical protein
MADAVEVRALPVEAGDDHRREPAAYLPQQPRAAPLWLPAPGVAARRPGARTRRRCNMHCRSSTACCRGWQTATARCR